MRKIGSLLFCLSIASVVLTGCAGMTVHDRQSMCPECTDEQWWRLNNPTPAERAENQRLLKQQQNQQATAHRNAILKKEALRRQKLERLQRCKVERDLLEEKDQTWIDLICKRYVETGSYF